MRKRGRKRVRERKGERETGKQQFSLIDYLKEGLNKLLQGAQNLAGLP